jgi:hypothetical protein
MAQELTDILRIPFSGKLIFLDIYTYSGKKNFIGQLLSPFFGEKLFSIFYIQQKTNVESQCEITRKVYGC